MGKMPMTSVRRLTSNSSAPAECCSRSGASTRTLHNSSNAVPLPTPHSPLRALKPRSRLIPTTRGLALAVGEGSVGGVDDRRARTALLVVHHSRIAEFVVGPVLASPRL